MSREEERQRAIRIRLFQSAGGPRRRLPPIPTGYAPVDELLGGGLPRGTIVELYGPESSGKSTLALRAVAQVQAGDGVAALIDADRSFDPARAAALGVSLEKLVVARPEWAEQALEIVHSLIESRALDLVVVDSAAALVPRAELESSLTSAGAGWHTATLTRGLRRLWPLVHRAGTCLLFLNQIRSGGPDAPESSAGARPLKAYAATRLELRHRPGGRIRLRVVSNKRGESGGETDFLPG